MFIVLSPAKTLDYDSPLPDLPEQTQPRLLDDSAELIAHLQAKSVEEIASLMKVSTGIAQTNAQRFADWQKSMTGPQARPAGLAFSGDVYAGLAMSHFSQPQLRAAQQRLRLLSGLYGLLRPLDRIRPYRLEMSTRLATERGNNLYQFWGRKLTELLAADMKQQGSEVLINLASQEYFKAIQPEALPARIMTPVFQDEKNGQYKVISFYAKKARGMMAAWLLQNDITTPSGLTGFDMAGYVYSPEASTPEKPVFRRAQAR